MAIHQFKKTLDLTAGPQRDGWQREQGHYRRKTLDCQLYAGFIGSTALTEKLGPEQAFLVIEGVLNEAVKIIEAYGGYPVDFAGDSILPYSEHQLRLSKRR